MLIRQALSITTILMLTLTSSYAIKFETLGYRSISMGGAAVANSSGSFAAYNNPALLAKTPYSVEVTLGAGVSEYDHGALASIKELEDLGFQETIDNLPDDLNDLPISERKKLLEGTDVIVNMNATAVTVAPQASLSAQVYNFGLGLFSSSDATGIAVVDENMTNLIFADTGSSTGYSKINDDLSISESTQTEYDQSSVQAAIDQGSTYLDVKGVALVEVPLAYGHNFESKIGNIMIGGALKYMQAITYIDHMKVDASGEVAGAHVKKDKTSGNIGIDIGLAYQPALSYDLTFGLVAKNLNSPEFDFADDTTFKVAPLVRAGIAYNIFESLQIAADLDLTSNKTLYNDIESQMIGGGLNYEPFTDIFALSLRAGLMQNLHSGDKAGLIYTAGVGIGVKWFQLDLSGEMSGNSNTVQDVTVPQYAKVNIALISRW